MRREMALFRQEIARQFAHVRQEIDDVHVEVASVKSDLSWRLFYFWSAQLVAIAGLLFAFLKFFR